MANRILQRARKPNYTKEETETLLDQLIVYGHFLFNKTQPVNNQQKADVWANIAMQVNSVPNSAGRTVDELKHRWQDMAQRARAVLRKSQSEPLDDKGTPCTKRPVPFLNKILQILGEVHRDGNRPEDSLLASVDSTYSSDSSCTNEAKLRMKEENDDQNTVVDLSQGNGSKTNSLKRSHSETMAHNSKSGPPETLLNKYQFEKSNSSSFHSLTDHYSTPSLYQEQFEIKRQKTKDSSSPKKSVSDLDQNNSNNEGFRVRQHMEKLRSMVLDPESQLVMEVEDFGGDERSGSTSRSASIVSNHEEDNQYNNNVTEDKSCSILRQQLNHHSQNPPLLQFLPTTNSTSNPISGNKPAIGQPFRLGNHYTPLPYHNGPQTFPHHQLLLDTLPKVELDRQCVISQIRMQDQQARYFYLQEKKVQLEIDILRGKCSCKNPPKMDESVILPPPPSPPSHQPSNSIPAPPCHLAISDVTSYQTKYLKENSERVESRDQVKENELDISLEQSTNLMSQSLEYHAEENNVSEIKLNGKFEDSKKENGEEFKTTHSPGNHENENGKDDIEDEEDEDESLLVSFGDKDCESHKINVNESETQCKNKDWDKALKDTLGL